VFYTTFDINNFHCRHCIGKSTYTDTDRPSGHSEAVSRPLDDAGHPYVDLSFSNGREAYRSKTTGELCRALLVFNLCSVPTLITHNRQVICSFINISCMFI